MRESLVPQPTDQRPARWTTLVRRIARQGAAAPIAMVCAAALLLASCGTVPGAAAVVDGQAISEQTVVDRTQALIDESSPGSTSAIDPATRSLFNRLQATDAIRHRLAVAAADAEQIDVTDAKVNAFIAQNGGAESIGQQLHVPAGAVPEAIYDYLVLEQLVDKIPAAGVDVTDIDVTVDVVTVTGRDAAIAARAKYLKDPAAMDADAAAARATGQVPGGDESLFGNAQDALQGVFSAPEGQIVLIPYGSGSYYLVRVTKRTEKPGTLTKEVIQGATSLDGYLVLASLLLSTYPVADTVTVNPRFGQWDPLTLQVVAGNSGL